MNLEFAARKALDTLELINAAAEGRDGCDVSTESARAMADLREALESHETKARINFAPLYADEATRPIVHALVAAIGYINGQSVNSAAVMTAALKVGLKSLDALQQNRQSMKDAIGSAYRDIGEWIQLAERQVAELPNASHNPLAPTDAGIQCSKLIRERIGHAARGPVCLTDCGDGSTMYDTRPRPGA